MGHVRNMRQHTARWLCQPPWTGDHTRGESSLVRQLAAWQLCQPPWTGDHAGGESSLVCQHVAGGSANLHGQEISLEVRVL